VTVADIRDDVLRIIVVSIQELNPSLEEPVLLEEGESALLYSDAGSLDSLALVTLISSVEQGIEDELGASVSLTDERALSQARSPFRTIGSLADFTVGLLADGVDAA
jgi:hypothetical protein